MGTTEQAQVVRLSVRPGGFVLPLAIVLLVGWVAVSDPVLGKMETIGERVSWFLVGAGILVGGIGLGTLRVETEFVPGSSDFYRTNHYFFFMAGKREAFPIQRLSCLELQHPTGNLESGGLGAGYAIGRNAGALLLIFMLRQVFRTAGTYELYANMEGFRYLIYRTGDRQKVVEWGQYLSWFTGARLD